MAKRKKQTQTCKVKCGIYQHYKGNNYEVLGIARHSETLEEFVIYKALYESKEFGKNAIWVRSREMFFEKIKIKDKTMPRFKFMEQKVK